MTISEKAYQGLYFVRKLKRVGVEKCILNMFYRSTINYIILSWYRNSSSNDWKKLMRVIKSDKRLGCDGTNLEDHFYALTSRKTKIMEHTDHPLYSYFNCPHKKPVCTNVFIPIFKGSSINSMQLIAYKTYYISLKIQMCWFLSRITVPVSKQTHWDNNDIIWIIWSPLSGSIAIQLLTTGGKK